MTIPQGLAAELAKDFRSTEHWYIEIDSDTYGILKLCQPGEENYISDVDVKPWLESISNVYDSEEAIQDASVTLNRYATDRIATEPLENHVCRVYRYRSDWIHRELMRTSRVWGDSKTSKNKTFPYRIISNLALEIEGEIPNRSFSLSSYPQLPETYVNRAVPLVMGSVKGWTPILAKAGGWGYLSEDIPPISQITFTGSLALDNYRGSSFAVSVNKYTSLTEQCIAAQTYLKVDSLDDMLQDLGTGYILLAKTGPIYELMQATGSNTSGGNWITPVYRSIFQNNYLSAPTDFPNESLVYNVGMIIIDNEIMLYRRASGDGIFQIMGGINTPPQPHHAGALVREYQPVYKWVVSARNLKTNSLSERDIKFYLSNKDALVGNPFRDIEVKGRDTDFEPGYAVGSVKIFSVFGASSIQPDSHDTPDPEGYEIITMNNSIIETDPEGQWSADPDNMKDETAANPPEVDPYLGDIPTTFTEYIPRGIGEESALGGGINASSVYPSIYDHPELWTGDYSLACDGDEATSAVLIRPAGYETYLNLVQLVAGLNHLTPVEPDTIRQVWVAIKTNWLPAGFTDAVVSVYFNGVVWPMTSHGSSDWYEVKIYDEENGQQSEHKAFFQDPNTYSYGLIQVGFLGHANFNVETIFSMTEVRLRTNSYYPSGNVRLNNTDDTTHLDDVFEVKHAAYLTEGSWRLTYDWGNDLQFEHDFIHGGGWKISNIWPIITPQSYDDLKKHIRIEKKDSAIGGKIYDVKMLLQWARDGGWSSLASAYDGNINTYALYVSDGGTDYAEFGKSGPISSSDKIVKVRIKINYANYLTGTCSLGIYAAGQQHLSIDPANWVDLPAGPTGDRTIYVDITGNGEGPGANGWQWDDFNTAGSAGDYAIYIKVIGTTGQQFKLYEISWDIVTGSTEIDPLSTPMVVDCEGTEDVIGGPYGGGLIESPADIYKFILMDQLRTSSDNLEIDSFDLLKTRFRNLCVNGVRAATVLLEKQQGDQSLSKFRKEFDFIVPDINNKLTPKFFPQSDDAAIYTFDRDNIIEDSFGYKRTEMESIINYPIAHYKRRFYNSDRDKTIIFTDQYEEDQLLRKRWKNPLEVQTDNPLIQKNFLNKLTVEDLNTTEDSAGNDWSSYWDIAYASYRDYNNKWFKRAVLYDFIFDDESARAMLARIISRYAYRRYLFVYLADPGIADFVGKYDPVYVEHYRIPPIPGKTTIIADSFHGSIHQVKCAVLSITPHSSGSRKIVVEVL